MVIKPIPKIYLNLHSPLPDHTKALHLKGQSTKKMSTSNLFVEMKRIEIHF